MAVEVVDLGRCVRLAARHLRGETLETSANAEWLRRRLERWGSHYRLFSGDRGTLAASRIRVAELAATAFQPSGKLAAEMGGQLVLWLFLFDDAIGEGEVFRNSCEHFRAVDAFRRLAMGRGSPEPGCGFQKSLQEWLEAARRVAGSDWAFRFGLDLCGYFNGCVEEAPVRRQGLPLPVSRYRELRSATVGTRPVFAVIELGGGARLKLRDALHGDLVDLRKRAALLTAWVNDLYSFPKEHATGDTLNLVAAMAHESRLEPEAAIDRLVSVYNSELEEFEARARFLTRDSPSQVKAYVSALAHWVHANRWWTERCGRYSSNARADRAEAEAMREKPSQSGRVKL